jgi:hypothetical protein
MIPLDSNIYVHLDLPQQRYENDGFPLWPSLIATSIIDVTAKSHMAPAASRGHFGSLGADAMDRGARRDLAIIRTGEYLGR